MWPATGWNLTLPYLTTDWMATIKVKTKCVPKEGKKEENKNLKERCIITRYFRPIQCSEIMRVCMCVCGGGHQLTTQRKQKQGIGQESRQRNQSV